MKTLEMLMLAGEKLNFGFKLDTKEPYTLYGSMYQDYTGRMLTI